MPTVDKKNKKKNRVELIKKKKKTTNLTSSWKSHKFYAIQTFCHL